MLVITRIVEELLGVAEDALEEIEVLEDDGYDANGELMPVDVFMQQSTEYFSKRGM